MNEQLQEKFAAIINLQGYEYRLWHYQASLSVLTIRAYQPANPGHNIHIIFQTVAYMQMPISWAQGDIRLGTQAEHTQIASQIAWLNEFTAEKLTLFVAEPLNSGPIYVLSHTAYVEYDVEPLY